MAARPARHDASQKRKLAQRTVPDCTERRRRGNRPCRVGARHLTRRVREAGSGENWPPPHTRRAARGRRTRAGPRAIAPVSSARRKQGARCRGAVPSTPRAILALGSLARPACAQRRLVNGSVCHATPGLRGATSASVRSAPSAFGCCRRCGRCRPIRPTMVTDRCARSRKLRVARRAIAIRPRDDFTRMTWLYRAARYATSLRTGVHSRRRTASPHLHALPTGTPAIFAASARWPPGFASAPRG